MSEELVVAKPQEEPTKIVQTKAIDWKLFDFYAKHLCTQEQIAAALGVSPSTLARRVEEATGLKYHEYVSFFREGTLADIQTIMTQKALAGDNVMLKTLAQKHLGYDSKTKVEISGENGGPVPFAVLVATMTDEEIAERRKKLEAISEDSDD
jgi:AraC-like DNA-binding protein